MGLERLHHPEAGSLPPDGQSGRADLQLVAPLRPSLRRRPSSGGDHQPAGLVEWGGSAGRSSKPTQNQSQLAARKQSGARTGYHPSQQYFTTLLAHRGALERPATVEFAIDSYFSPLARWQMAWNAPAGGRITPLGLRSPPLLASMPVENRRLG